MLFQLLLSAVLLGAPNYFSYTSPEADYSFEVNENASYTREPSNSGYTDNFDVTHDTATNLLDYTLVLTRVNASEKLTLESLATAEVKDSFQSSCNCVVTDYKKVKYKNFTGVLYSYNLKIEDAKVNGYTVNIPKNETMYSLSFVATDVNFAKYKSEFEHTINTLQLLKP